MHETFSFAIGTHFLRCLMIQIGSPCQSFRRQLTRVNFHCLFFADARLQENADSTFCITLQLIFVLASDSEATQIWLQISKNLQKFPKLLLPPYGGFVCQKITPLGKQSILDLKNTVDCHESYWTRRQG